MRDSKAEFEFLDFARRSRKSEGLKPQKAGGSSKPRAIHAEPTNEELGIVPYSGRVVALGYALYIALVIGFLVWLL